MRRGVGRMVCLVVALRRGVLPWQMRAMTTSTRMGLRREVLQRRRAVQDHHQQQQQPLRMSSSGSSEDRSYDVVVIGGGHAGTEAASAAARVGARTALLTQRASTIGEMSCNPSIGGIGKGHLVREIDAMGGIMGMAIDEAGIHFRMLNRRKGEAVWGPRAQADRDLYKAAVQRLLGEVENVEIVEGSAEDIVIENGKVVGVRTGSNEVLRCKAAVLTTGTFLRGRCYVGHESYEAGRHTRPTADSDPTKVDTEPAANSLARLLEEDLKLPLGRLKTGTPPRLDGRTIDWDRCDPQPSEDPPFAFSYLHDAATPKGVVQCYRTKTNSRTHAIVMEEAHTLAPPSTTGTGPRYCPSIYKKVERFGHRDSHGVWLEPEGLDTDLVYPNGLSGAYPLDVQRRIVRSIVGLERAEIVQTGYDVEYDFVDPTCLGHDLGLKSGRGADGLFLAGQICGTTGYEEAGSLGVVAGANAGLAALGRDRFVLTRRDGYAGVLVDDLVTRGTLEPYRVFTSRAEYRLHLRADNADLRLTPLAREVGLVGRDRFETCLARHRAVDLALSDLEALRFPVSAWYDALPDLIGGPDAPRAKSSANPSGRAKSAREILAMPRAGLDAVLAALPDVVKSANKKTPPPDVRVPADARDTVAAVCKYGPYLDRHEQEFEAYSKNQQLAIPPDVDYSAQTLPALSAEEREKLLQLRPKTMAEASHISGLTPASLVYLYNHVLTRHRPSIARRSNRRSHLQENKDASSLLAS